MADVKNKEGKTPRDVMRVVFRRKFHFFAAACAAALAVLIGSHWMGLKYTGTTKFTLRSDTAAKTARSGGGNEDLDSIKLTLQHDILDRKAVEKVIFDLKLDRDMPHNAQGELTREGKQQQQGLVDKIQRQAKLSWEVKSTKIDLLSLSVTSDDRTLAQQIPNELVKNYIERTSEQITRRLVDSNSFLTSQVNSCAQHLKTAHAERTEFQTQHDSVSPEYVKSRIDDLDEQIKKLMRDRETVQERLRDRAARIINLNTLYPDVRARLSPDNLDRVKALLAAYKSLAPATQPAADDTDNALAAAPTTKPAGAQPATGPAEPMPIQVIRGPNPEYARIKGQLDDLERALQGERLNGRKDAHPVIQKLLARIDQVKKQLADTPEEIDQQKVYATKNGTPKPADPYGMDRMLEALSEYKLAKSELGRVEEDIASAKKEKDDQVAQMAVIVSVQQQWQELNNRIKERENELKVWQDRRNQVRINLAGEVAKKRTHMETVQAAQELFLPSSPKLSVILGGALFAALAAGAGWVLLLNLMDRSIPTTDKAAELFDLPIHGVIGEIVSTNQRRHRRLKRWLVSPIICSVILLCVAAAALSVSLRLQYPDLYPQWKANPVTFVYGRGAEAVDKLIQAVKSF